MRDCFKLQKQLLEGGMIYKIFISGHYSEAEIN